MKASIDEVSTSWLPRALAISDILIYTSELRINQLQHAFATDDSIKQTQAQKMIDLIDQINENMDTYERLTDEAVNRGYYSNREQRLYQEFNQKWEEYQIVSFDMYRLSRINNREAAISLLNGAALDVFNEFRQILNQLVDVNSQDASQAAARAEHTFRTSRSLQNILFIFSIIISFGFIVLLVRYISYPIRDLERAAQRVADGDLSVYLNYDGTDEIGSLARSFNRMTASLNEANQHMQRQAEILKSKNEDLSQALSELRNTKEQLMLKEKMAALGNLVAGIAHEINNPIGTVLSSSDVIARCVKRLDNLIATEDSIDSLRKSKQLKKYVKLTEDNINNAVSASKRITAIVKSLKNFSRVDESEFQIADIHEGLNSTLVLLENEMRDRIQIIKDFGDLPKILCNPGQLNQVFINLLRNASQSIDGTGCIKIRTIAGQNYIMIQISDTGIGIPQERLDQLFNFGFAVRDERVKLGSGLATSYSIIQQHKGEIEVESTPAKGTTFTIYLPIQK